MQHVYNTTVLYEREVYTRERSESAQVVFKNVCNVLVSEQ